jgi:hypothetical protein
MSAFSAAVNISLKMGVNRGCNISVNFRTDVFEFLFKHKAAITHMDPADCTITKTSTTHSSPLTGTEFTTPLAMDVKSSFRCVSTVD